MNISWYDCELLRSILKRELKRCEDELSCMRMAVGQGVEPGRSPSRCFLPPTLANASVATIEENIDPWCSMIGQIKGLIEEFSNEERRQLAEIEKTKGELR